MVSESVPAASSLFDPEDRPAEPPARGRAILEEHFDFIQRRLRHLGRRSGLPEAEAEEFRSWALLKLVEDDCRILAHWQGRSSLATYLGVVLVNLMRDYRTHVWGKWRTSAAALRQGSEGVLLERLVGRESLSLDEAIERMRTRHGVTLSRAHLERIASRLPRRSNRRQVGEEELMRIPVDGGAEDRLEENERIATAARLQELLPPLLDTLPAENRLLLELHYRDGLSMAVIAPVLGRPQRELYSLRDRCLKKLRRALEGAGLSADRVKGLTALLSWEFQPKGERI